MMPSGIALASLLMALPATGTEPPKPPAKAPAKAAAKAPRAKSKAPVTVTTVFGEGTATVTLRFEQAVEGAAIGVRGLDGAQVEAPPPLERTSFARGEVVTLEVPFTPGSGRSHLAVDIEGTFRGQHRMAVQTFAFGKPSPEQLKASSPGTVVTTEGGQRLKLMPVKQD